MDGPELKAIFKRPEIAFDDARGILTINKVQFDYRFFSQLDDSELLDKPVKITRHIGHGIFIEEFPKCQD